MILDSVVLSKNLEILAESIERWDGPIIYLVLYSIGGFIWFGVFSVLTLTGVLLSKFWQKIQIKRGNLIKSNDSVSRVILRLSSVFISVVFYWIIGSFIFEVFNLTSISQRDELIILPFASSSVILAAVVHYFLCKRAVKLQ